MKFITPVIVDFAPPDALTLAHAQSHRVAKDPTALPSACHFRDRVPHHSDRTRRIQRNAVIDGRSPESFTPKPRYRYR